MVPMMDWTPEAEGVLRREWAAATKLKTIKALGATLGCSVTALNKRAAELALPDLVPAVYWRTASTADVRRWFTLFEGSRYSLAVFAKRFRVGEAGLFRAFTRDMPAEYDRAVEAKRPKRNHYASGRDFEYRVRDDLIARGYFVARSAGSKTVVDLLALKQGRVLLVQCKRHGALSPAEWNKLYDLAEEHRATPVRASTPKRVGVVYERLDERKDGQRREPVAEFEP